MEILQGQYKAFESGTVVIMGNEEVKFVFAPDFTIKIIFEGNETTNPNITSEVKGNELVLKFNNFNNSLGTCSLKPIVVGTLRGMSVSLLYAVYTIGDEKEKSRVFNYTWLEKKAEVK